MASKKGKDQKDIIPKEQNIETFTRKKYRNFTNDQIYLISLSFDDRCAYVLLRKKNKRAINQSNEEFLFRQFSRI